MLTCVLLKFMVILSIVLTQSNGSMRRNEPIEQKELYMKGHLNHGIKGTQNRLFVSHFRYL